MIKGFSVAVVGATGVVGREMINTLQERRFPVRELRLLASSRSAGKKMMFQGRELEVQELREDSFRGIQIALFSAGASVSKQFAPAAVKAGAVVVDNTSAFRMDANVPLVVPEVNPDQICRHHGIIANPNCSTIQMVVVLKPLHDEAKIKRIVVSTYQSVSGAGAQAMETLKTETASVLKGEKVTPSKFAHPIAFNLIPQIDVFLESGYTKEEMKMVNETKKIMGDPSIQVTATCVRVPVMISHSESVNVETEKKLTVAKARSLLKTAAGVCVMDQPEKGIYPVPIHAAGKYDTFVGRIREDDTIPNGLNLWVVSDNLLKGAALNAVQIAEKLMEQGLVTAG